MDTSISKALIMVAGVLLAMIVMAFVARTFMQTGEWATVQDDEKLAKQRQEFNREFEVYDKDLMYGVDLISCLNKAKSNNDKIEGKYSEQMDSSYAISVQFTLQEALKESIRVYHMESNYERERNDAPSTQKKLEEIFKGSTTISNLKWKQTLAPDIGCESKIGKGTYTLQYDVKSQEIEDILSCASEVKQTVKNRDGDSANSDSWTKAIWETVAYDLKTRKFKCSGIEYNSDTGRVNKIIFTELKI